MWFSMWFDPGLLPRRARLTYDVLTVTLLVVGLVVTLTVDTYWGSSLLGLSVATALIEVAHARSIKHANRN
jgi:hypothetical protein